MIKAVIISDHIRRRPTLMSRHILFVAVYKLNFKMYFFFGIIVACLLDFFFFRYSRYSLLRCCLSSCLSHSFRSVFFVRERRKETKCLCTCKLESSCSRLRLPLIECNYPSIVCTSALTYFKKPPSTPNIPDYSYNIISPSPLRSMS